MKNDVLVSIDTEEKFKLNLWAAHIDVGQVQFIQNPDLGIDFYNRIDAWRKMEVCFKHRIERPNVRRCRKEFLTLHYSFREKII